MSNPFHVDTPHYAAWERVRTLRISPDLGDINLRELVEEIVFATETAITEDISNRVREATLDKVASTYGDAQNEAENILSRMNRLVELLDKSLGGL